MPYSIIAIEKVSQLLFMELVQSHEILILGIGVFAFLYLFG